MDIVVSLFLLPHGLNIGLPLRQTINILALIRVPFSNSCFGLCHHVPTPRQSIFSETCCETSTVDTTVAAYAAEAADYMTYLFAWLSPFATLSCRMMYCHATAPITHGAPSLSAERYNDHMRSDLTDLIS
jgi:hypothetical protein